MKKTLFLALLFTTLILSGCTREEKIDIDTDNDAENNNSAVVTPSPEIIPEVSSEIINTQVYFNNSELNPDMIDCSIVFPVGRQVIIESINDDENLAKITATLLELFKGPTSEERSQGYTSWFTDETSNILQSVKLIDEKVYLSLSDIRSIIPNASTSCGGVQFLAEINQTLKQFSNVNEVIFAIDNNPEIFYEWIQIGCPAPGELNNYCDPVPFNS